MKLYQDNKLYDIVNFKKNGFFKITIKSDKEFYNKFYKNTYSGKKLYLILSTSKSELTKYNLINYLSTGNNNYSQNNQNSIIFIEFKISAHSCIISTTLKDCIYFDIKFVLNSNIKNVSDDYIHIIRNTIIDDLLKNQE